MSSTSRSAILGAFGQGDQPAPAGLADLGRGAERLQQRQDGRVLQPRPQDAFRRRMNLGEQAVEPVGDPGGLARKVVVEAHDHLWFGDRIVRAVDRPQAVGHRAGSVRDDERVPRVGLGLPRVEVGEPPADPKAGGLIAEPRSR